MAAVYIVAVLAGAVLIGSVAGLIILMWQSETRLVAENVRLRGIINHILPVYKEKYDYTGGCEIVQSLKDTDD